MRPRFIIRVVFATLLLPGAAVAQDVTPAASPGAALTFEGQIDAGGERTLHLACAGTGGPPVLLEWGGPNVDGATSVIADLGPDLAAALGTRFCAYDRAGTGQSPPDPVGVRTVRGRRPARLSPHLPLRGGGGVTGWRHLVGGAGSRRQGAGGCPWLR